MTSTFNNVTDPTVAGDIDGDGRDEIFVYHQGTELVYRHDGTRLPGWEPVNSGMPNIADLDGDGISEFISATVPLQNIPTVISARHADGASLPGFPVDAGVIAGGTTMVGDIDGDGHHESLVIANYGSIRKVTDTGQISVLIPPVDELCAQRRCSARRPRRRSRNRDGRQGSQSQFRGLQGRRHYLPSTWAATAPLEFTPGVSTATAAAGYRSVPPIFRRSGDREQSRAPCSVDFQAGLRAWRFCLRTGFNGRTIHQRAVHASRFDAAKLCASPSPGPHADRVGPVPG